MKVSAAVILNCALVLPAIRTVLVAQQVAPDASGGDYALSLPYKTASYSFLRQQGITAPYFSHGYVIQFKRQSIGPGDVNVYLYDSSGNLAHEIAASPKGVTKVFLTSVDVGAGGQLAFVGQAAYADGRQLLFVATSDLDGSNPKYFSTGNYRVSQIAQADDGSIWAVGAERAASYKAGDGSGQKWNNYDILRHYSSVGVLLEHYLPRWGPREIAYVTAIGDGKGHVTMAARNSEGSVLTQYSPDVSAGYQGAWKGPRQAFLRSAGGYTVLYDGSKRTLYRYTVADGFTSQRVAFDYGKQEQITGFSLSPDGHIYASIMNSAPQRSLSLGAFTLSFPPSGSLARWSRISTNIQGFAVLGSDGSAVVYRDKTGSIYWSTAKSQAETNGR